MANAFGRKARYVVVEDSFDGSSPLILKDVGPWSEHPTITHDAESVVEELIASGKLSEGQRLLYYDSEGELTELLIDKGHFAGFASPRDRNA